MERLTVDVGAGIDDHGALARTGNDDQNGRPRHLRQPPHDEHADRHHRAGIAGADHRVSFAALHQLETDPHGRIFFAQGDAGRFVHRHHLGRRDDVKIWRAGMLGKFLLDGFLLTDQDDLNAELASGEQGALDHDSRGMISAHRIDGDFRHGQTGI